MGGPERKIILITGATSGIGLALTKVIHSEGHYMILAGRDKTVLNDLKSELGPHQVKTIAFDLSKPEEVKQAISILKSENTIPDMIIHSGGLSQREDVMETSLETVRYIMEVNFFSTVVLTKAFLPDMVHKKKGHIVLISSVVGKIGTPKRSGYAASKHALHGFYDSLRAEVADSGILVTLICPGYIRTNISLNATKGDGERYNRMDQNQESGMPADKFARKAWKKIKNGSPEFYIGGKELLAIYLKRFFPGILRRIVQNVNPK